MTLDGLHKAYQAENIAGSYFTAPLRAYHGWFAEKLQSKLGYWESVALKVAYFISGIIASITLGAFALIGTAINYFILFPRRRYSLWAHINRVPHATDTFLKSLKQNMISLCSGAAAGTFRTSITSSDRGYSYTKNHAFTIVLKDVFLEKSIQKQQQVVKLHFNKIQDNITRLSQSYNWIPEKIDCKREKNTLDAYVILYIPDQCQCFSTVNLAQE